MTERFKEGEAPWYMQGGEYKKIKDLEAENAALRERVRELEGANREYNEDKRRLDMEIGREEE